MPITELLEYKIGTSLKLFPSTYNSVAYLKKPGFWPGFFIYKILY